jgi:hypothetical protein
VYIDQTGQFPDIRQDTELNPNAAAGNFANLIQPIRQSSQFTVAAIVLRHSSPVRSAVQTPAGRKLFHALQDHGGYQVDATG